MKFNRNIVIFCALAIVIVCAFLAAMMLGAQNYSFSEIWKLFNGTETSWQLKTIMLNIRLPRAILALLIGLGLGSSGACLQGILRNPLADPYTLGISGGASLGAAVSILLGFSNSFPLATPLFAFAGAMVSLLFIYVFSSRKMFSSHSLILSGVILSFVFSSLVLFLFSVSASSRVHWALMWLMGNLSQSDNALIFYDGIIILAGTALLTLFSRDIDMLALGHDKAATLGINPKRSARNLIFIASFITAACVSSSGIIGFVGLIVPHASRKIFGASNRVVVIASALLGSIFLLVSDTIARTLISPVELPVGVVTGLFGGIFFLIFMNSTTKE